MPIRYLRRREIDDRAWNQALDQCTNGRIYAYTWYLDHTAGTWDALVLDDYRALFPLPYNRKFILFPQVFQPLFSQQLGLFVQPGSERDMLAQFLAAIPRRYLRFHLALNELNHPDVPDRWQQEQRTNYLLSLHKPHEELFGNYAKSLRKRIRRASKELAYRQSETDIAGLVDAYRYHHRKLFQLPDAAYQMAEKLFTDIQNRNLGTIHTAVDAQTGEKLSELFLPRSHGRLYHLFGYTTPVGKNRNATHFLLDQIIRQHAGQSLTLDFEGSSIPGVAAFFASFGAQKVSYPVIRRNRI